MDLGAHRYHSTIFVLSFTEVVLHFWGHVMNNTEEDSKMEMKELINGPRVKVIWQTMVKLWNWNPIADLIISVRTKYHQLFVHVFDTQP